MTWSQPTDRSNKAARAVPNIFSISLLQSYSSTPLCALSALLVHILFICERAKSNGDELCVIRVNTIKVVWHSSNKVIYGVAC